MVCPVGYQDFFCGSLGLQKTKAEAVHPLSGQTAAGSTLSVILLIKESKFSLIQGKECQIFNKPQVLIEGVSNFFSVAIFISSILLSLESLFVLVARKTQNSRFQILVNATWLYIPIYSIIKVESNH